ncbi:MAG: 4Fe-4S dicluster domain-containing protein [Promethearchaeota archaeon]
MSTYQEFSQEVTRKMREEVKKLFDDGKVDLVIGYTDGTLPLRAQPLFLKDAKDVEDLKWDNLGYINLAKYLLFDRAKKIRSSGESEKQKIGIISKGCVGRAINHLVVEKQVKKDDVVIIGFPCNGIVDVNRIEKELGEVDVESVRLDGDDVVIKFDGEEKKFPLPEYLNSTCKTCVIKSPPLPDVMIGESNNAPLEEMRWDVVEPHEKLSADEKWDSITNMLSSCIECYACRQACPMCYCNLCFIDQNKPIWFNKTHDMNSIMIFHMVRANHVAGRCVNCGACYMACPMGINLNLITEEIEKIIKNRFDFVSGMDRETEPPMMTFKFEDSEDFMIK